MGVIAEGIPRGCQGLFTPVSLGYPLSVFIKNSTLDPTNLVSYPSSCCVNYTQGPVRVLSRQVVVV